MNNEKERYIGSVLFYKHLIIGMIFLFIIVTTVLCGMLFAMNSKLSKNIYQTSHQIDALQYEVSIIQVEESKEEEASEEVVLQKPVYDKDSWELLLVNGTHAISNEYEVVLTAVEKNHRVDQRIEPALQKMLNAMRAEGLKPVIYSAYRTIEEQAAMFEASISANKRNQMDYTQAFFETKQIYTLPGSSEHHSGLAVDILSEEYQVLDEKQGETKEAKWLAEHCAEYGFILRYPMDKKYVTGVEYHPWHFRYVGEELAAYIMENGLTLEEFLTEA